MPENLFLGFNIERANDNQILVSQTQHIKKYLETWKLTNCNTKNVPIHPSFQLERSLQHKDLIPEMRRIVGALNYLATHSRPDIILPTSLLSSDVLYPSSNHVQAAKNILAYLKGTASASLLFPGRLDDQLIGYVDAEFGGDRLSLRPRFGYIFFLFGAPICWKSSQHDRVSMSTFDAEIVALSHAIRQSQYLRPFLSDLGFINLDRPTTIFCDNMAVSYTHLTLPTNREV